MIKARMIWVAICIFAIFGNAFAQERKEEIVLSVNDFVNSIHCDASKCEVNIEGLNFDVDTVGGRVAHYFLAEGAFYITITKDQIDLENFPPMWDPIFLNLKEMHSDNPSLNIQIGFHGEGYCWAPQEWPQLEADIKDAIAHGGYVTFRTYDFTMIYDLGMPADVSIYFRISHARTNLKKLP